MIDIKLIKDNIKNLIKAGHWGEVCKVKYLSKDFIRKNIKNLCWAILFRYQKFDLDFIEELYTYFSKIENFEENIMQNISKYQVLSENFIEKHILELNLCSICEKQKISAEFILKHVDKFATKRGGLYGEGFVSSPKQVYSMPPIYFLPKKFYTFENVKLLKDHLWFGIIPLSLWEECWFYEFEDILHCVGRVFGGEWTLLLNKTPIDIFEKMKSNITSGSMISWIYNHKEFNDKEFNLLSNINLELETRNKKDIYEATQNNTKVPEEFKLNKYLNANHLSIDQIKILLNYFDIDHMRRNIRNKEKLSKLEEIYEQYMDPMGL